ncbi:MAG: hypothetical protein OHK0024_33520 [Thalassobaculales bacterium]
MAARLARAKAEIEKAVRRIAGPDAQIEVGLFEEVMERQGESLIPVRGALIPVPGRPYQRFLALALKAGDEAYADNEVLATARHELLHVARRTGMISEKAWRSLDARARAVWIERYQIKARYPDLPLDMQIEEAVADAYGEWSLGRLEETGIIARAFRALRDFLADVLKQFRGRLLKPEQIVEEIFRDLERGRLARKPQAPAERHPAGEAAAWARPDDIEAEVAKGEAAMATAIRGQRDVMDAMTVPGIGPVSFIWGRPGTPKKNYSDGGGIAHIIAKHGEGAAHAVPLVLSRGEKGAPYGPPGARRVNIKYRHNEAALSQGYLDRGGLTWVLTAWDENVPDVAGESDNRQDYARRTSGSRSGEGAGTDDDVAPSPADDKTAVERTGIPLSKEQEQDAEGAGAGSDGGAAARRSLMMRMVSRRAAAKARDLAAKEPAPE